ncbi:MAG: hypothetical protein ACJASX_000780 [Limisphaerales bacterium]|jgi:hypothetical protein
MPKNRGNLPLNPDPDLSITQWIYLRNLLGDSSFERLSQRKTTANQTTAPTDIPMQPYKLFSLLFAFAVLIGDSVRAEAPNFRWATRGGSDHFDYGTGIAVDNLGNTFVTGYFSGKMEFDEDQDSPTLDGVGEADIFLAKIDRVGKIVWARQAGGTADDFARAVAIDNSGNVYVTGAFQSPSVSFGNGKTITRSSDQEIFIAKYDPDGNLVWANSAGSGPGGTGNGVDVDLEGNVYVSGYFYGQGVFNDLVVTNSGYVDSFVARYDPNGELVWVRQIGGHSDDVASSIVVDEQGSTYVCGAFSETMRVSRTMTLESRGLFDVFLMKIDSEGRTAWAVDEGGSMNDIAYDLALDPAGNIIMTGGYAGSESFGSEYRMHAAYRKPRRKHTRAYFSSKRLTSNGGSDIFVAKYNPAGRMIWVQNVGGNKKGAPEAGYSVAVDARGHSHVTGTFAGKVMFGNNMLMSQGIADLYVMELDRDGRVLWARQGGSRFGKPNVGYAIDVDRGGNSYVTGYFQGNVSFGHAFVKSYGDTDIFVAKITASHIPPR